MTRRVAVIGGGVSGLTAAFFLQQRGLAPTVFESSPEPGGKIRATEIEGIRVEEGPDAFLPRDDRPLALLRTLGLGDDLVSPAVFGAYIWLNGRLRRLPPGSPYGIPRSAAEARRAGLLSAVGAARASLERFWPRPLTGPDIAIGALVRRRFGAEVVDRMVDPLLAGVRGGRVDRISLAAGAREVDEMARRGRSITAALRVQGSPAPPRFVAPRGGMGQIISALRGHVEDVRSSHPVDRFEISADRVMIDGTESFEAAVLAVPTAAAAAIVEPIDARTATLLRSIEDASIASIALVYPGGAAAIPTGGSGFLVPTSERMALAACTWYSAKWPTEAASDRLVLRAVAGRAGQDPVLDLDDEALVDRVRRDLATTMGITAAPLATRVTRWERSIPQYAVGHLDLVEEIEGRLAAAGPIFVTGPGYRGSGIPDCIAQAARAAGAVAGRVSVSGR